ncbi:IS630 family transposase [Ottowia pentelensis]|uniref:IS630 family transposase n=3 Tax=Ottowia pentelensis TaxID=511108 RepID=UPI0036429D6B
MARTARGADSLESARQMLAGAQTAEQLRQAQAVVLPLDYGLSLEQTAQVIGRSPAGTCRLRNRFLAGEVAGDGQRPARGGRRHQNMTTEQERQVLAPFLDRARTGGILVVGQVKCEIEAALGRPMALSSVYNLLHRHGWRKLAPDKRHPQSDPLAQEEWKKLPERLAEICSHWPQQGPIKLMFQDEARFGRINDVRRCWAPKPVRPLCQAMLTHEYTYAYAAVDVASGQLDSLILPHVNTECMQLFLDEVSERHPHERIVMVLDGAGWHASGELHPPANMRLLSLPPMRRSSTRWSTCGTSCARSDSTTASSTAWRRSKITLSSPCETSRATANGSDPSSPGRGLLMRY